MSGILATDRPISFRFWTLANVFTFARFALAPVCAYCFMTQTYWGLWVGGWAGGLAMFTDFCDGYFARRQKQVSDLGKIFDPLADAVFFVMVWAALGLSGAYPIWFVLPFVVREFVQHVYLRPSALNLGVVLGANFWGKLKTLVQTLVFIALCWLEFFCHYWPWIESWVKPLNMALIGVTGLVSVLSIIPYFGALRAAQKAQD
ncbi:MAG: CDP-alcohol phosphatidyltransferase family protein [Planctomycetes bacterium]|nr:CDP-alcohol phosphatidyltransferase family protein [Planctomycetota bacterium]